MSIIANPLIVDSQWLLQAQPYHEIEDISADTI
jgi:hypothetical protein